MTKFRSLAARFGLQTPYEYLKEFISPQTEFPAEDVEPAIQAAWKLLEDGKPRRPWVSKHRETGLRGSNDQGRELLGVMQSQIGPHPKAEAVLRQAFKGVVSTAPTKGWEVGIDPNQRSGDEIFYAFRPIKKADVNQAP